MGMSASQGRLLFMTARISDNEFEQQSVAYSKQRLADDSQQANDMYLDALQRTQYHILVGYSGDVPQYEPVCYNQLTSLNSVAVGQQYIVSDNKNQIVVTDKIAKAFDPNYSEKGPYTGHTHNDFNTFLKNVSGGTLTQVTETNVTEADVHDAWDKYFVSIKRGDKDGIYYDPDSGITGDHILGFSFRNTETNGGQSLSYVTYNTLYFHGTAGNQIFLQEDVDKENQGAPYFYFMNYPVEVESYRKDDGSTAYVAKYKLSENIERKQPDAKKEHLNLMQDSDYIYLDNVDVEASGNGYIFYKMDINSETGVYERVKDSDGNYETYNTSSDGKLYVSQDYGSDIYAPTIVDPENNDPDTTAAYTKHNATDTTPVENTIFYQGTTAEQRDLFDYAMAITEKYASTNPSNLKYDGEQVQYYKNIYNQMITRGYTTFAKMVDEKYINTLTYDFGTGQPVGVSDETQAFQNDNWLINLIKNGKLSISYYDKTAQGFVTTSLDDDESIVEKENKSKMAIAEQVYQKHMDNIERQDKQFDMQLTRLESEHTALTTEYESVAKVISKNVEKSFSIFNA